MTADPTEIFERVADFFCDHRVLQMVGKHPDYSYRCSVCGRNFKTFLEMSANGA